MFRLGSANVLGQFAISDGTLVLELAQIDGGGEGILPALSVLSERYARKKALRAIEWLVYAVHCAQPNLKLRRVLERKGFTLRTPPGKGACYFLRVEVCALSRESFRASGEPPPPARTGGVCSLLPTRTGDTPGCAGRWTRE